MQDVAARRLRLSRDCDLLAPHPRPAPADVDANRHKVDKALPALLAKRRDSGRTRKDDDSNVGPLASECRNETPKVCLRSAGTVRLEIQRVDPDGLKHGAGSRWIATPTRRFAPVETRGHASRGRGRQYRTG